MKIALGADHGGFELKEKIKQQLEKDGYECHDFGCFSTESCDYPVYGEAAARAVASGECELGIVICTTGIGISMVANKVKGALCWHSSAQHTMRKSWKAEMFVPYYISIPLLHL